MGADESVVVNRRKMKRMKRENGKFNLVMISILCALMCAHGAPGRKKIRVGVDEDGHEKHMVRLNSKESNDLAVEIYNDVKQSLVLVKGKTGEAKGIQELARKFVLRLIGAVKGQG